MCTFVSGTDLAIHIKEFEKQKQLLNNFDINNEEHHLHLLCLFMTAADLSDQTKNWTISRKTAVCTLITFENNVVCFVEFVLFIVLIVLLASIIV